jgi:hypothetical protein
MVVKTVLSLPCPFSQGIDQLLHGVLAEHLDELAEHYVGVACLLTLDSIADY